MFALFHTQYAAKLGKPRWGVQSVSEDYYTELILTTYPTAQMIYLIRDPRDRHEAMASRRSPKPGEVAASTASWLYSVKLAKHHQQLYPDRFKVVRYEALVSQPEAVMRDVLAFLDESYEPIRPLLQNGVQYRDDKISTDFVGRFRQAMPKHEIAFMQICAKQDMMTYNYELEPIQFSFSEYVPFYFVKLPTNWMLTEVWRLWRNLLHGFPAWMGPRLVKTLIYGTPK